MGDGYRWRRRARWDARRLVEDAVELRADALARLGCFAGRRVSLGSVVAWYVPPAAGGLVRFEYPVGGQAVRGEAYVSITVPEFGGCRYWWICPMCGRRRVAVLWRPADERVYGCRDCHRLTYASTRRPRPGRAASTSAAVTPAASAADVVGDLLRRLEAARDADDERGMLGVITEVGTWLDVE